MWSVSSPRYDYPLAMQRRWWSLGVIAAWSVIASAVMILGLVWLVPPALRAWGA